MNATQIDLEKIAQEIETYKMELLALQDGEDPISEEEALETSIDVKIDAELTWEADVLDWIGYFGVVRVNEQILEQQGNIHQALATLMAELFAEKVKEK